MFNTGKEAAKTTWEEYLEKAMGMPSMGIWIKDIAKFIINNKNNSYKK
jgi:hypothetical protein